jgi:hypothetical protein
MRQKSVPAGRLSSTPWEDTLRSFALRVSLTDGCCPTRPEPLFRDGRDFSANQRSLVKARFQFYRAERQLVRWRLLGGNNRVLGMSMHAHPDEAACVGEVDLVRTHLEEADFELDHVVAGLWVWRMSVSARAAEIAAPAALATAAHGFARRVEAALAALRFRDRARTAGLNTGITVFNTRRSPDRTGATGESECGAD